MTSDDSARLQICGQCDTTILTNSNRNYCDECANGNSIPIEELEALADEWTKDASQLEDLRMAGLVKHKAEELREVIETYE